MRLLQSLGPWAAIFCDLVTGAAFSVQIPRGGMDTENYLHTYRKTYPKSKLVFVGRVRLDRKQ